MEQNDFTDNEMQLIEAIKNKSGILQSEISDEVSYTARTVSRLVRKMEEEGVITRNKIVHEGSQTYELSLTEEAQDVFGDELDYSLLMAGDMISPLVTDDDLDPIESEQFGRWIMELVNEDEE